MSDYESNQEGERFGATPYRRRPRSFFWPIILIGVGVVILLMNLDIIARVDLWSFWRLWPVLLILAGLDILFSRRWPAIGALLGLLVVGGVIALLIFAPSWGEDGGLPWGLGGVTILGDREVQSATFSEPIGEAEFAVVNIDLTSFDTTISPLADSSNLIEARVDYVGNMRFDVTGGREKRVILGETREGIMPFSWWTLNGERYSWDIGLAMDVPMELTVGASSGSCDMDLHELALERLDLDGSSGRVTAALPGTAYEVRFEGSSGSATFDIPANSEVAFSVDMSSGRVEVNVGEDVDLNLDLVDASSGALVIRVPDGAAVQVVVSDTSSGRVRLPSDLDKVREGDDREEGTWETSEFDSADHQIVIQVKEMSSGEVVVQYD